MGATATKLDAAGRQPADATPLRRGLASRSVVVLFAVGTLIPLIILTYAAITLSGNAVRDQARAQVRSAAALESRAVDIRIHQVDNLVTYFSRYPGVIDPMSNGVTTPSQTRILQDSLDQMVASDPGFASAAAVDAAGLLVSVSPAGSSDVGMDYSEKDWFLGISAGGDAYVSSAEESTATGQPLVVVVASPLWSSPSAGEPSRLVGFLSVEYKVDEIQQFVTEFNQTESVALTVTDNAGTVLASPTPRTGLVSMADDPRVSLALGGSSDVITVDGPNGPMLSAYTPVGDLGWTVHADILESEAFAEADRLRLTVLLIASLLGCALLVAAWALGRVWRGRAAAELEVRQTNDILELQVEQRTKDIRRVNAELEAFTYSVSHDLRSPLRAMSGFSEALLDEYADTLDDTGRGYANRIKAASLRMAGLIDDLLQLSRVSRAELHLETVDISTECAAILKELADGDADRRVDVTIEPGMSARADRLLVHTVLENLLGNAWKYTSKKPDARIEVCTVALNDAPFCLMVRDNGAGFDAAYADKLFQPFQRLHTASDFPGNGIGLVSAKRIVERHGGRIWADATLGEGATFHFTLNPSEAT